jgi:hypothetical protein
MLNVCCDIFRGVGYYCIKRNNNVLTFASEFKATTKMQIKNMNNSLPNDTKNRLIMNKKTDELRMLQQEMTAHSQNPVFRHKF